MTFYDQRDSPQDHLINDLETKVLDKLTSSIAGEQDWESTDNPPGTAGSNRNLFRRSRSEPQFRAISWSAWQPSIGMSWFDILGANFEKNNSRPAPSQSRIFFEKGRHLYRIFLFEKIEERRRAIFNAQNLETKSKIQNADNFLKRPLYIGESEISVFSRLHDNHFRGAANLRDYEWRRISGEIRMNRPEARDTGEVKDLNDFLREARKIYGGNTPRGKAQLAQTLIIQAISISRGAGEIKKLREAVENLLTYREQPFFNDLGDS